MTVVSNQRMPGPFSVKRKKDLGLCFFKSAQQDTITTKSRSNLDLEIVNDVHSAIFPGLPDDVSKYCLALVPRSEFPAMGAVCKRWRSFIKSKELIIVRKLAGMLEEWLYILTANGEGNESHWEVLDCLGHKHRQLPPMPGPIRSGFGVVVLNGKLLVIAGYSVVDEAGSAMSDVYQYDSCLNR